MDCSRTRVWLVAAGMVVALMSAAHSGRAQLEGKTLQAGLDQIAALNAYAAVAAEGYRIVENGWHGVAVIRQGEWNLHQAYYGSLLAVNPAVRGMPEVADIIRLAPGSKDGAVVIADLTALLSDGKLGMTDGERMQRIILLRERLK